MKSNDNISAYILAGGKSSRMGTDKGLVFFREKPMVKHVIDALKQKFSSIKIISNASEYTKFGLPVIPDLVKETGPIGGIYTGLMQSSTDWNFFVACDMPFLDLSVIEKLEEFIDESDCVVATVQQQPEPLCAFYNKSCIPVIGEMITGNNFKLQDLLKKLRTRKVEFDFSENDKLNPFLNLNSMNELLSSEKYDV